MTENINVRSTLTAVNEASPVIRNVIADLKKLDRLGKSFNASFANLGRAGIASLDGFSRAAKSAAAEMHGIANTARSASRSYSESWTRATDHRLNESRRLYTQLEQMESTYRQQIERTAAAERRAVRGGGIGRGGIGSGRLPAPSLRSLAIGGVIGGAGIASALKKRMEVQAAEVRSQMFGDLSQIETEALRKSFADKAGIKYGIGTSKALDVATEGLKAGIAKQFAGEFGDLALKAQSGLDIPSQDVAKLLGRLATQMLWDKGRFSKVLNAVAVTNNDTAADGKEIVEAMRRSLSALVTTRMTPEQLAAINGSNISLGIQPFKSGTYLSFLTSQVAGADSVRWGTQQAKDLNSAGMALGFGGRGGMAQAMRDNPVQAYLAILDRLAEMPEKLRTKVAKQLGGREWMDELLTSVLGRDKLREVLKDIESKPGFLDKVALQKIRSMQGRWASISAAFGLAWERIGAGAEAAFDQVSDAILDLADQFDFGSIKNHFEALVDGLREGFGLKSWGDAVKAFAKEFDAGTIAKWRAFGKGFADGIRNFGNSLATAFSVVRFLAGSSNDSEGLGRFTAKMTGLVIALALLSPVLTVLGVFTGLVVTLANLNPFARIALGLTALAFAIRRVLDFVADKIFSVFVSIVDSIKNIGLSAINTVRGWIGLAPLGDSHGASGSWTDAPKSSGASGGWSPTSQKAAQSFNNPGATPASATGSGLNSDAYSRMFAGTALAGKSAQIAAAAKANGIPPELLGAVIAHETGRGRNVRANNVAGLMNPETGFRTKQGFASLDDGIDAAARTVAKNYRSAGGDLGKMGARYSPVGAANDPNGLNKNWPTAVAGYQRQLSSSGIMGKDPVAVASQFIGKNEYRDRADLTNFVKHDVIGSANAWCSRFVNASLREAGIIGSGSAVANSFQRWGTGINPANVSRGDVALQPNGRGPDQPGGHVGLATGRTRMVDGKLQLEMLSGNDGDSVRTSWRDANRIMIRRPSIQNVPPAEAVKNVPSVVPNGDASLGGGGRNGNVAIHINGGSHEATPPEAAERRLAAYIGGKYAPARTRRDVDEIEIADVLAIYHEDRREGFETELYKKRFDSRINRLNEFFGGTMLGSLTAKLCNDYAKKRGNTGGARRDLEDLRAAIGHHARQNLHHAIINVTLPPKGESRDRWLTREEAAKLIRAAWTYREKQTHHRGKFKGQKVDSAKRPLRHVARFILIGLYTGTRAAAIATASPHREEGRSYVDFQAGVFHRRAIGKRATTKRQTPVALPDRLLAHMKRWKDRKIIANHFVEWNGKGVASVKNGFARAVEIANLSTEEGNITPHTLRHTAATWLMQRGVEIWDAAGYLGMSEQTLRSVYGHHHPNYQRKAAAAITSKPAKKLSKRLSEK